MTGEHPLLQRAMKYRPGEVDLTPPGCVYDPEAGAWRLCASGTLWVDTPQRVGPRTKKQDIETGEDQKGE